MTYSTVAQAAGFRDVAQNHLNYEAIGYVQYMGIVKGYEDGTYRPGARINRAEFTKIIIEANFAPGTIQNCDVKNIGFTDVSRDVWFAPYVCVAVTNDIIRGYPDGTFHPEWDIRFTEAAKIMVQAFGYLVGTSEIWYEPYVVALQEKSAIPETIADLSYNVRRGEMAEMIFRLKKKVANKPTSSFIKLAGRAPAPSSNPKEAIKPVVTMTRRFKDGFFQATAEYISPGGRNKISVELVLENDVVESYEIKPIVADPISMSYIGLFESGIEEHVVGKDLDDIQVPRKINGSSLTSSAFESALVDIRTKASQ